MLVIETRQVELTPTQTGVVNLYRRLKQAEKLISDRLDIMKAKLLALVPSQEFIGTSNGRKAISVKWQAGRATCDLDVLKERFPQAYAETVKQGASFRVIRLH